MRRYALLLALPLLAALTACRAKHAARKPDPLRNAYDTEVDWNNPDHLIPLDYQQSQGKRLFYVYCVWCHADSTPAGPSNRSNLNPTPHLINDGTVLNSMSDTYLDNIITLGGSAMGKSASMPPLRRCRRFDAQSGSPLMFTSKYGMTTRATMTKVGIRTPATTGGK